MEPNLVYSRFNEILIRMSFIEMSAVEISWATYGRFVFGTIWETEDSIQRYVFSTEYLLSLGFFFMSPTDRECALKASSFKDMEYYHFNVLFGMLNRSFYLYYGDTNTPAKKCPYFSLVVNNLEEIRDVNERSRFSNYFAYLFEHMNIIDDNVFKFYIVPIPYSFCNDFRKYKETRYALATTDGKIYCDLGGKGFESEMEAYMYEIHNSIDKQRYCARVAWDPINPELI